MFAGSRYRPAGHDPAERQRKARALALALAAHAVVIVVLLRQQVFVPMREQAGLTTINIAAPPAPKPEKALLRKSRQAERSPEMAAPPSPRPPVEPPPEELPFMQLSRADFAASDVGRLPSQRRADAGAGPSGPAIGPGEGPGGRQLFAADWYRKPTSAELGGYLPASAPRSGWGMIACRTVDRYEVDDCRVLGEFPLGSGFARAVRQAAWQFRVIPPRIDGKPMIGAWVRIRIEYSEGEVVRD